MRYLIFTLSCVFALTHPFEFVPPKQSSPQQEIIAQLSSKGDRSFIKVALVMPKKIIGRYSTASIDTIMAYLTARGVDFEFEVFDSIDEEKESIQKIYRQIIDEKFHFIIAILTTKGAYATSKIQPKIPIYIPTVNVSQINFHPSQNPLLFFGGISYKDQIQELLKLSDREKIIAYNDDSPVGERLADALNSLAPNTQGQVITNQDAATFNKQAQSQEVLIENADVFLNAPVVKSGLLLSQIGYFRKRASKFLSTQINFNPSITILTQKRDRKNLFIASSIGQTDQRLIEYGSLLNSDLKYDWVNYSTALGVERFFRIIFPESQPFFQENFTHNQINYKTKVYCIDNKNFFVPIDVSTFQDELEKSKNDKFKTEEDFSSTDSQIP